LGLHCYAVSTHPDEIVLELPLKKFLDAPTSHPHGESPSQMPAAASHK